MMSLTRDDLNNLYKGRLMEQAVGQELLCRSDDYLEPLSFWVREKIHPMRKLIFA